MNGTKKTTEPLVTHQTVKQKIMSKQRATTNSAGSNSNSVSSTAIVAAPSASTQPPNHLFMNGKLKQQNGHMIMTNVYRPTRKKYLNIDSRFHDGYQTSREKGLASLVNKEEIKKIEPTPKENNVIKLDASKKRTKNF